MTYDEALRAHQEHLRISMSHPGLFDPVKVSAELPEPSAELPEEDDGAQLTHGEVDAAVRELADQYHKPVSAVSTMLALTHQRADLGHSVAERVQVIAQVEKSLRRGMAEPDREQILQLSGHAGHEVIRLSADHSDVFGLTVSAEQRRELAKKGEALGPDGDFPCHDRNHVQAAAAEFRKGHLAGHSAAEVKRHILKNAKRLGVDVDLDDSDGGGDDVAATVTLSASAGPLEQARHAASHGDTAEAIMSRHSRYF
jgi:hypothetical protein